MKLTVPCPGCRSGLLDLRALRDAADHVYGYRGRCSDCGSYTELADSAQSAIQFFKAGMFAGRRL